MLETLYHGTLRNGQPLCPPGSDFVMAEWSAEGTPAGSEPMRIAPLHAHRDDDEAWYVLEGTLCFQVGDRIVEAGAGQAVIVPRGTPHTYWNPNVATARYLIFMTVNVKTLIDAIHAMDRRDPDSMQALFERHQSEWLG